MIYLAGGDDGIIIMTLEEPLTELEKRKFRELVNDPRAMDTILDKALKGWRRGKSWKKQTKKS